MKVSANPLEILRQEIISCTLCPRLTEYRARIAQEKRRAYREWEYWGRPVPPLGDSDARLLIIGLAPRLTAEIAPAACSPATVPAIFSIARCTARIRLPAA